MPWAKITDEKNLRTSRVKRVEVRWAAGNK
jgi:hypothetical protein